MCVHVFATTCILITFRFDAYVMRLEQIIMQAFINVLRHSCLAFTKSVLCWKIAVKLALQDTT